MKNKCCQVLFPVVFVIMLSGCGFDTGSSFLDHFPDPPDTTNLFEFANFMDAEQIALVIAEETTLMNGKKRLKCLLEGRNCSRR